MPNTQADKSSLLFTLELPLWYGPVRGEERGEAEGWGGCNGGGRKSLTWGVTSVTKEGRRRFGEGEGTLAPPPPSSQGETQYLALGEGWYSTTGSAPSLPYFICTTTTTNFVRKLLRVQSLLVCRIYDKIE